MIAFPLRRMQSFITRNDLLRAITIARLYCNVLKVHFGYLLHRRTDGTTQSCLFLCLEVGTSFLIMLKLIKLATGTLTFPGTGWYLLTARDPQMVRDQKKLGN